jgi:hypothetical protein
MAETGEPYTTARREVIKERQRAASKAPIPGAAVPGTAWFAISFGPDRITALLDTLSGGGPGRSGVEVAHGEIRVRMGNFKLNVPRSSVRSVARSQARIGRTTGVHAYRRGRLLVNGSADGLVELSLEPPCYTGRTLTTMFVNQQVTSLMMSLVDPDGFVAAVEGHGRGGPD